MGKAESICFQIWNKVSKSTFTALTKLEIIARAMKEQKQRDGIRMGKEEVQISMLSDDVMSHMESPEHAAGKLLELITNSVVLAAKSTSRKTSIFIHQ